MTEKITAEQKYATYVMNRLPNPEKREDYIYVVGKGESLWTIAKKQLNSGKKPTNQEISDYMLLLAKLNGFNTIEQMNNLHVNDKIYLPDATSVSSMKSKFAANNISQKQNSSKNTVKQSDQIKSSTSSELSITALEDFLVNNKDIKVDKMYKGYPSNNDNYHVYRKEGFFNRHMLSFVYDNKKNKVIYVSFEDKDRDLVPGQLDYTMDNQGDIFIKNTTKKVGKVDKEQLSELDNILSNLTGVARPYF